MPLRKPRPVCVDGRRLYIVHMLLKHTPGQDAAQTRGRAVFSAAERVPSRYGPLSAETDDIYYPHLIITASVVKRVSAH